MTLPLMHKTATELSAKFAGLLTDTELQQLVEARKVRKIALRSSWGQRPGMASLHGRGSARATDLRARCDPEATLLCWLAPPLQAVQLNLESPPSSRDNSHQAESSQTRDATENTADSDARASFEPASVTSKPAVARASRNESELSFAAAIKPQPPGFLGVAGQGEVVISMGSGTPGKPRPPAFMDDVDFTFDDDSTTGFNAEEFYNRNIKWKEAREKQAEEQRRVREQAAVKECTFTPRINKKSARLAAKAEYVTLCTPRPEGFSPEAAADAGSGQSSPDAATVPHAERMYQAAAMYRAKLVSSHEPERAVKK